MKELEKEVLDLQKSAQASKDAVARRQLELAAASLREEMDRLGELRTSASASWPSSRAGWRCSSAPAWR
ncbi:MAG: hypothetical protein IPJ65_34575 [Archangiaceae bacterium]|nr:hypothetical protein [Archangiaceae bacterium]